MKVSQHFLCSEKLLLPFLQNQSLTHVITRLWKLELEGRPRRMEAEWLATARGGQLRSSQEGDVSQTLWRRLQSQRRPPAPPALEARGQPEACLNVIDAAREHGATRSCGKKKQEPAKSCSEKAAWSPSPPPRSISALNLFCWARVLTF